MEKGLSIALVIGVLLNLTKGADMILLDSQKKYLQIKVENFTIFLDDIKPIKWFNVFTTLKAQIIFFIIGLIEFSIIVVIALRQDDLGEKDRHYQYLIIGISFLSIPFSIKLIGLRTSKWLVEHKSSFRFICRYALMILIGFLFFAIYMGVASLIVWAFSHQPNFESAMDLVTQDSSHEGHVFNTLMVLIWPVFTLFWVLVEAFGLLIYATLVIFIIEFILKIVKGIMWRIVQYNKGVFSAIILIITVCLGIYETIIKK